MKNLCYFCILATVFILVDPARAVVDLETNQRIVPRPIPETELIVTRWFDENGYKLYRKVEKPFKFQLDVQNQHQHWSILLTAHSPLATMITVTPAEGDTSERLSSFWQYIDGFSVTKLGSPLNETSGEIPPTVQDQLKAVVCIHYQNNEEFVRISGFAIDPKGVIVTTAHDLKAGYSVDVQIRSGRVMKGRVFKIDPKLDLCLIQVPEILESTISLRNARYMPGRNDLLYALGCSENGTEEIRQGILDGLPRRVQGLLLWQVKMNIEHGNSGSPVLDNQGRLAAVVKGRFRGSNRIGFLIPFESLLHFLEKY